MPSSCARRRMGRRWGLPKSFVIKITSSSSHLWSVVGISPSLSSSRPIRSAPYTKVEYSLIRCRIRMVALEGVSNGNKRRKTPTVHERLPIACVYLNTKFIPILLCPLSTRKDCDGFLWGGGWFLCGLCERNTFCEIWTGRSKIKMEVCCCAALVGCLTSTHIHGTEAHYDPIQSLLSRVYMKDISFFCSCELGMRWYL